MLFQFFFRVYKRIIHGIMGGVNYILTEIVFRGYGVNFSHFRTGGRPYVMVARGGKMTMGRNFAMNNGIKHNPIGMPQPCTFFVDRGCTLTIGDNVGISQTALIAHADLTIGDNVKIGGGTCVYTSDFHSLDAIIRASKDDQKYRVSKPVIIEHDAFIGARCLILKGVTIGAGSIIGAGSVVTRSVPAGEIWAGNPARFIRKI